MPVVRDLITRLGFQVDQRGAKRGEQAVDRIGQRANYAAMQVRNIFAGFLGFQGLRGISQTLDEVQSLEARIDQMTQTANTAAETFDEVSARATAARQPLSAYANLYIRIGNATQDLISDQSQVLQIVDTVSQAMIVGGTAASEQASAMLQLSQAFNKGKLDGDEFRAVMEAMPPAFTRGLAAAMGYKNGLQDFYDASANGELTIQGLIKAIQEIGPSIQDQFLAMPMTISQAFTIIGNRYSTFVARMNRETSVVTRIAGFFLSAFDVVEGAIDGAVEFVGGFENALKLMAATITAIAIPVLANFTKWLLGATVANPFAWAIAAITAVILVLEDLYQWVNNNDSAIGNLLGSFDEWADKNTRLLISLRIIRDTLKEIWDMAKQAGTAVGDFFGRFGIDEQPGFTTAIPSRAMSQTSGGNNVNVTQDINIAVPEGTTQEQMNFIKNYAGKELRNSLDPLARELGAYNR